MNKKSSSEAIIHSAAIRMRVVGIGNLLLFLRSLDNVRNTMLKPIPMETRTNREPTVLSNFNEQRIQLHLITTNLGEIFNISKIIMFVKPVATDYPIT